MLEPLPCSLAIIGLAVKSGATAAGEDAVDDEAEQLAGGNWDEERPSPRVGAV